MSELRRDIITGEWVIIATERAKRPENFKSSPDIKKIASEVCPFCTGNEQMTPSEVFSIDSISNRKPDTPDWKIRVVPNKFPALLPDIKLSIGKNGIYEIISGFGIHEVIINTPEHVFNISDLSTEELKLVVKTYIQRVNELKGDERIKSIIIMLNQGKEAGASLEHTHSQVFGVPIIPPVVGEELQGTLRYFNIKNSCAMCDIIKFEKKDNKRIVFEDEFFVVLEPFASKNPFETWIVPKRHNPHFEKMTEDELESFTNCLKIVVDIFYGELGNPAFNYYIHTGPTLIDTEKYFHWHLEFVPKLTIRAGFEIGTGVNINITTPEYTADFMKSGIKVKR